ncbi:TM2 domain-containing protein [Dysgonomonas massiliensis]|uniref:TM2 domain-containing protein n=1 Tax=Dysgonomonas massiliensis TaxID=2040292 RepID=UPI0011AFA688|nr:TM2 domain-containing protein [Dysgonomonas massiliensis]
MEERTVKYCPKCGQSMSNDATICPGCGEPQVVSTPPPPPPHSAPYSQNVNYDQIYSDKDWLTTLLLAILTGCLGVHRFYTGHIAIGVIQLLTGGGCGIWALIDLIMIITGNFKDSDGRIIKEKSQR